MVQMQMGTFTMNSQNPSATGGDTSTFEQVDFPAPFPPGATVVVLPMVQSFNGGQTPGLRIADVTNTGFKIRMNEVVMGGVPRDGRHTVEAIGWIAVSF